MVDLRNADEFPETPPKALILTPHLFHDGSFTQHMKDLWDRVSVLLDDAQYMFQLLFQNISDGKENALWVSKQRLTIAAGDLSNTFGADDTCTFTSQTAREFNFIGYDADLEPHFRQTFVRLGGSPPMHIVGNIHPAGTGEWERLWSGAAYSWATKQGFVYASGERTLVVRNWNDSTKTWDALAWPVDADVFVWQIEPAGGWERTS